MNGLSLPIVMKDKDFVAPNVPIYYLLSADGLFLVKKFQVYRSCTKVEKGLLWLEEQSERIELDLPKVPRSIFEQVVAFFYLVYRLYDSEAIVFLYYNPEQRTFRVLVPEQEVQARSWGGLVVGSYHVDYSGLPAPLGFVRLGTIHSHGDLPAFYSLTDERDSEFDDSLNIVVGNLARKRPSFFACFMVNGRKFDLGPEEVVEPYRKPRFPVPREWLDQVVVK